jgi:hypothetical protein
MDLYSYSVGIPLSLTASYSLPINDISGPVYGLGTFYDGTYAYDHLTDVTVSIISSVPEPTTLALLGTGLLGLAMMRRRKLSRTASPHALA